MNASGPNHGFALMLVIAAAGCIVIPTNYHSQGSRQNLSHHEEEKLMVGVSSKQETLLLLGEPEFVSDDGQVLRYDWSKVRAIWALAGSGYMAAMGEIEQEHSLELKFDEQNMLASKEVVRTWDLGGSPERRGTADYKNPNDITLALPDPEEPRAGTGNGPSVRIEVRDSRAEKDRIGYRSAAFNVHLGNVYSAENVSEHLKRRLAHELLREGFQLKEAQANFDLTLNVKRYWVYTRPTLLYFDMIAEVACEEEFTRAGGNLVRRAFESSKTNRTYAYPTKERLQQTLKAATDVVMEAIVEELKNPSGSMPPF